MRLIDVDNFKKFLHNLQDAGAEYVDFDDLHKFLDEQSTAYDVGRVAEQEAKICIQGKLDCMNKCDVFDCKHTDECDSCNYCYSQGTFEEQKNAFEMAIKALEEIQQYRALGTPEEWRAAVEKQKAKKM